VTIEANIQDMSMISDQSYDTAICLQVLEHVPNPQEAVREIFRIMKPGGQLILSIPHLSRIHDEPNDFQRYTEYGIRILLEEAGFHIEEILARGGLFSFLGHQVSSITVPLVWRVPLLKDLIFAVNSILVTHACYYLDRILTPSRHYFPLGYTVLATMPGELT
jgi:SAM-dependent methyltransferase